MNTITIALNEDLVRAAQQIAAERSTTLSAMVGEALEELVRQDRARKARRRIASLCRESRAQAGPRSWRRDELHRLGG